ncbi:inorganic pyrophosphatase [Stylonychia lemnae]|uniref:inorganic diphosphatase n=1 Tax=Stylonychia lemnae TaxID=5949 RepID=A0A078AHX7_STYLE|nr:inorganic pyrophosphatase [Stylonychia lemnae]|eukprot:CDW81516.1 inorganic pyrophosphatase [Stylonychia lemnae]
MEVATTEELTPVKQDIKKDKQSGQQVLRFYGKEPPFNYGMIPQTWENNKHLDKDTQCYGDNDPLDIVELGRKDMQSCSVTDVKVLGAICLIDQGELDWKILTMNVEDSKYLKIRNIDDFTQQHPGAVKEIFEWFRMIKTYDGKPQNRFGHDEKVLSVEKTLEIICDNNGFYRKLVAGKLPNDSNFWLKHQDAHKI